MAYAIQEHNRLISSRERAGNAGRLRASQPPPDTTPVHSVEMHPLNCEAISWALDQDVSSASASRLLIEISRRSHGGRCAATQKALGEACKLSERQTRTLLASLIADGVITRTRQGGTGAGRAPDVYDLQGYSEIGQPEAQEATGNDCREQPAIIAGRATGNRQFPPEGGGQPAIIAAINRQFPPVDAPETEATGSFSPVDNPPRACIEHAGARAQTLNLLTVEEIYPERGETSSTAVTRAIIGRASSDRPPPPMWQRLADDVGSPLIDPNKHASLVLKGGLIDSLAKAGADYTMDILPTVRRLIATRTDPVRSWGYFVDAIREATATRLRAEAPMEIITPQEAKLHDQRNRNADPGVRRRQRSLVTDRLMRTIAEGV